MNYIARNQFDELFDILGVKVEGVERANLMDQCEQLVNFDALYEANEEIDRLNDQISELKDTEKAYENIREDLKELLDDLDSDIEMEPGTIERWVKELVEKYETVKK